MIKAFDIPPNEIACARRLTHAATDEEAIRLAVKAFNERGEPLNDEPMEITPASPGQIARLEALLARARAEVKPLLEKELARVANVDPTPLRAILGTFDSLVSDEEFEHMRRAN